MDLEIPLLETERLTLRPFREGDVAPFFDLSQDPDVYGISRDEWKARRA
jgi:RimJ/RimL family protein N-acetyltransferase